MISFGSRTFRRSLLGAAFGILAIPCAARARASVNPLDYPVLRLVDGYVRGNRPDSALTFLEPVVASARANRDSALLMLALRAQGACYVRLGHPIPAVAVLGEALRLAAALGDSVTTMRSSGWLANAVESLGSRDSAAMLSQRALAYALALGDREGEAWARVNLAFTAWREGRLAEARQGFSRAVAIHRARGDERAEGWALNGLGNVMTSQGDYDGARGAYLRVLDMARRTKFQILEGQALNNLGGLEQQFGDPAAAARYYRAAVDLFAAERNPQQQVTPSVNLALALTYASQYEDAATILTDLVALCRREGYRSMIGNVLTQLGHVRLMQLKMREAAGIFREVLAEGDTLSIFTWTEALTGLAKSLSWMDSTDVAITQIQDGLARSGPRMTSPQRAGLEEMLADLLNDRQRYAEAYAVIARMRQGSAAADTMRLAQWILYDLARAQRGMGHTDSALVTLRAAASAWERDRGMPTDPQLRALRSARARDIYAELADVILSDASEPSPTRRAEAFDAMQTFKARTLLEGVAGPRSGAGSPATAVRPVTVAQLQDGVLAADELFLDVFLGPFHSYLFAVTRTECRALRLPGQGVLGPKFRLYADMAGAPPGVSGAAVDETDLDAAGDALGALLTQGIDDLLRTHGRLVLSADGPLNQVPVAALRVHDGTGRAARALIETHDVVRVPSASVLARLRENERASSPERRGHILAVAARDGPHGERLDGAMEEVRGLASRFDGVVTRVAGARSATWLDPAELERFDVVHLAGHATVDDEHPWLSGLLLVPAGPQGEAQYLRAARIAEMRLPAHLVVLSSCVSGAGQLIAGEGVIGLSSAFLTAGVPAVVATLWAVDDRTTARLMSRFYDALQRGASAATALSEAQRALRRSPDTRHPFYWAGFVLVGDGGVRVALTQRPAWTAWYWARLAALGAVVAAALLAGWRSARARAGADGAAA